MKRDVDSRKLQKNYDIAQPDLKDVEKKMNQSKTGAAVSWFFIIAAIVLIQFSIYRKSSDAPYDDSAAGMQIQLSAKYITGIKQMTGQNPMMQNRLDQMEQQINNYQGGKKHLAGIPVMAEISGREAAMKELDRMAADPDSVSDSSNLPVFYRLYHDGSASLDSTELNVLKDYGWVGRLALSQDKSDTDPERRAVLQSASRLVLLAGLLTMAAVAVLIAGVILFIITMVKGIKGTIKSNLVMPETPGVLLLETFAIYLVLSTSLPLLLVLIVPGFSEGRILMSVAAGLLPILWPLFRGAKWNEYRTAIGWHRGKGIFREVGAGIVGYITGLPLMVGALIIVMILVKHTGTTPSHPVVFELNRSPLFIFLLASVYAPFVEETLFRGALYGYLRRSLPWAVSGIITGFIFAILHPQGWIAVPIIGVIGFNFCAIREWRGSAIASMTAHAMNNGSLMLILIIALS